MQRPWWTGWIVLLLWGCTALKSSGSSNMVRPAPIEHHAVEKPQETMKSASARELFLSLPDSFFAGISARFEGINLSDPANESEMISLGGDPGLILVLRHAGEQPRRLVFLDDRECCQGNFDNYQHSYAASTRWEVLVLSDAAGNEYLISALTLSMEFPGNASIFHVWRQQQGQWSDVTAQFPLPENAADFGLPAAAGKLPMEIRMPWEENGPILLRPHVPGLDATQYAALFTSGSLPEIAWHWQPATASFEARKPKLSAIAQYFLQAPDGQIHQLGFPWPFGGKPGTYPPGQRWDILQNRLPDGFLVTLDPTNGYLLIEDRGDGAGQKVEMTYWNTTKGEKLIAINRIDWAMCCETSLLRFFHLGADGRLVQLDGIVPEMDLAQFISPSQINTLHRKMKDSPDHAEVYRYHLPQSGKNITVSLDWGALENLMQPEIFEQLQPIQEVAPKTLKWDGAKFHF